MSRFSFLPSFPPQCDRLAADCAHELRRHGVSYVSLWPGLVQTELVKEFMAKEEQHENPLLKKVGKERAGEVENERQSLQSHRHMSVSIPRGGSLSVIPVLGKQRPRGLCDSRASLTKV